MDGIIEIGAADARYPAALRLLGREAPDTLYCLGDTSLLGAPSVAVVGARKATEYGKWAARQTGRLLGEHGLVTISGLAYGCDAQAHRGALEVGGRTVAVLAGGVDICYPKGNAALYRQIRNAGLLLSETPPGTPSYRSLFPQRNRIISALSAMVVVAEASEQSGSLITAGHALNQGREVMAFPANITSGAGRGCNLLIRDGAAPVTELEDILLQLGIEKRNFQGARGPALKGIENTVFQIIKRKGSETADQICEKSGLDIRTVNGVVSILELHGLVRRTGDRIYINTEGRT